MNKVFSFLKKYILGICLLAVEIVLLTGAARTHVNEADLYSYVLPYNEWNLTVPFVDQNGCYIDSQTVPGYSGLFTYSNPFSLPRGSYSVTVEYSTDTHNNTLTATADTERYNAFRMDKIVLDEITNSRTFDVVTRSDAENVVLNCNFGGSGSLVIRSVAFHQNNKYFRTSLVSTLFLSFVVDLLYALAMLHVFKKFSKETWYGILCVGIVGLLSSIPMMTTGLKVMDDMSYHMLRIKGVATGLLDGQFPVRLNPNWAEGYGYSASTIYNDCFLYIPGIMRLIGYSLQTCWKTYIFCLNFATAFIMFHSAKTMFRSLPVAVIGTIMYSFAPMRLMEIYPRGDIGEGTAMAFLPLIVLGLYKVYTDDVGDARYKYNWVYLTLGYFGLLSCHITTPLTVSIFVLLTCVVFIRKTLRLKTLTVLLKTVAYTALLTAWFLLPCFSMISKTALTQSENLAAGRIQGTGINISQIFTLVYPAWGELLDARSGAAGEDAVSIGLPLVLGCVLFLSVLISERGVTDGEAKKQLAVGKYLTAVGVLLLFMTTCYFPWDLISSRVSVLTGLVTNIQMPWRFSVLAIVVFVFVFLIACDRILKTEKTGIRVYAIALVVFLGLIAGYFNMDTYLNELSTRSCYDEARLERSNYFMSANTYPGFDQEQLYRFPPKGTEGVTVVEFEQSGTTARLSVMNEGDEGSVLLPMTYYAEYVAQNPDTGESLTVLPGDNQLISVVLPADYVGSVMVQYKEPVSWRVAEVISLLTFMALCGTGIYCIKKTKKEKQ